MAKSSSAERYRLRDAFAAARNALLADTDSPRLDRALAYWALPADRRLPVALLDRTLRDILEAPFDRLAATPGIGQKKLGTLIVLMRRAYEDPAPQPAMALDFFDHANVVTDEASPIQEEALLNPDLVSETQWTQWCVTARVHELGRERLGRLAPSLQGVPTVIWGTLLSEYFDLSLAEVRRLKTHGEKRVRVVLEVFRLIHQLLGHAGRNPALCMRLAPRFIPPLEEWFCESDARGTPPDWHEVRSGLVLPLLNQLAIDAGPLVQKLAEGRMGVEGPPESVRVLAKRVGVTRARVYQLLETCQRVMAVRWPEGRLRFESLALRWREMPLEPETWHLYQAAQELCFPHRGVADAFGESSVPGDESADRDATIPAEQVSS